MARSSSQTTARYQTDGADADWGSLRDELVTLLQRVDREVGRDGRDMRQPVADDRNDNRHRDALRSVQRAIDRFEDASELPPNPRDHLQSAIQQIRARQAEQVTRFGPPPFAPAAATAPAVSRGDLQMLDRLTQSVSGLGARLERLEGEIKAQVKSGASVKDVADQVAQLAHVVELLAGAVGETGQVKRLEGQIASLGKIMTQGREMDIQTLTRRLDDVATTVGKLAELQVHYTDLVQNPVDQAAFQDGMRAIEENVRNVYDRIDMLEQRRTLTPDDLQAITDRMGEIAQSLKDGQQAPLHLVELVDALNARISEIESGDRLMHSLRKDMGALRDAVIMSLAPRFDAIESRMDELSTRSDVGEISRQIEALNARMAERPYENGMGQLEAQVRQLVARMDQTGEQLSGLAKLYAEPAEVMMPDFDAVAEMVANRAAAALQQNAALQMGAPVVDTRLADTIASLELRIGDMLSTMKTGEDRDQFSGMQTTIDEVNERLKRLETSLAQRSTQMDDAPVVTAPSSWSTPEATRPLDLPVMAAEMSGLRTASPPPAPTMRPRLDSMPRDPNADVPLNAPAFPDPVPSAAHSPIKKLHPGLDSDMSLASRYADEPVVARTAHAPEVPELPPAPTPSAEFTDVTPGGSATATSRNTFIEAHRRAAQRTAHKPAEPAAAQSLIGRALSRFQPKADEPAAMPLPEAPKVKSRIKPEKVPPRDRLSKAKRKLMPESVPGAEAVPATDAASPSLEPVIGVDLLPKMEIAESFLSRHRKAILLGAAVVALAFLTINLVAQRLTSADPSAEGAAATQPADTAPASTGSIDGPALIVDEAPSLPPRVAGTDTLSTGSIDSSAALGFTSGPLQPMPSAFAPATDALTAAIGPDASAPAPLDNGVKVEPPPDSVGPEALRTAAANGDARAQFEVGAIYTEGRAVPQDFKAAAVWYERAAAQGFAPAEYRLGSLYESGNGVDKDPNTARLWYERAAEAGNRMSMHNLAALYAGGALGKQAFDAAAKWFEEAATLGLTDSQFNLGMLYARGLGVPQDLKQSYKWFGIAALSGDKDAAKARDDMARSLDADTVAALNAEVKAFVAAPVDLKANFAPLGTWSASFDPGESIVAKDIVASVQRALGRLGFDVGTPDGVAGKKTKDAIRAFETATGMSASGEINPRLLAVLGSQPV